MESEFKYKNEIDAFYQLFTTDKLDFSGLNTEVLISMLKHHDLFSYANYLNFKNNSWKSLISNENKNIEIENINMKARYNLVLNAFIDAIEVLQGIDWLIFKGLSLCQLYPEPWMRNPGDIDIVVPINQFNQASQKFLANGWEEQPTIHWKKSDAIAQKFGFARVFKHPDIPVIVDLHRHFVDETELFPIPGNSIFRDRIKSDILPYYDIYTPSFEDNLLLIALHSVRHGTFRPGWFLDIKLFHENYGKLLDYNRLISKMKELDVFRAVNVAHHLTDSLYSTKTVFINSEIDVLSRFACKRRDKYKIFSGHLLKSGSLRRILAMVDLVDDYKDAIKYCCKIAFPNPSLVFDTELEQNIFIKYLKNRGKVVFSILNLEKKSVD